MSESLALIEIADPAHRAALYEAAAERFRL